MGSRFYGFANVVADEVGVDGDGSCGAFACRGNDLGAGVGDVPGNPNTRNRRPTGRILDDPIAVEFTTKLGEQVVVRYESGRDEESVTSHDPAIVEYDSDQVVVLDHYARQSAVDYIDPSCGEFDSLLISQRGLTGRRRRRRRTTAERCVRTGWTRVNRRR